MFTIAIFDGLRFKTVVIVDELEAATVTNAITEQSYEDDVPVQFMVGFTALANLMEFVAGCVAQTIVCMAPLVVGIVSV